LNAMGALAFARTISQPGNSPELHRAMSTEARANWKLAKDGVYAQVRAQSKPKVERVRSALQGRKGRAATGEPQQTAVRTNDEPTTPSDTYVVVEAREHKDGYAPL